MGENKKKNRFLAWLDGEYILGHERMHLSLEERASARARKEPRTRRHHEKSLKERFHEWSLSHGRYYYHRSYNALCTIMALFIR